MYGPQQQHLSTTQHSISKYNNSTICYNTCNICNNINNNSNSTCQQHNTASANTTIVHVTTHATFATTTSIITATAHVNNTTQHPQILYSVQQHHMCSICKHSFNYSITAQAYGHNSFRVFFCTKSSFDLSVARRVRVCKEIPRVVLHPSSTGQSELSSPY